METNRLTSENHLLEKGLQNHGNLESRDRPFENQSFINVFHINTWRYLLRPICFSVMLLALIPCLWSVMRKTSEQVPSNTDPFSPVIFDPYQLRQERFQYEECPNRVASETRRYNINATSELYYPRFFLLRDWFDPSLYPNLRGRIEIDNGSENQATDIEVHLVVSSNSATDINNVYTYEPPDHPGLYIEYDDKQKRGDNSLCTELKIVIYIRPDTSPPLDMFGIRTGIFDVEVLAEPRWRIESFNVFVLRGIFFIGGPHSSRTANDIWVGSIDGFIAGYFIPGKKLKLQNEIGDIAVFLVPPRSDHSFDPKNISVSTTSGNVRFGPPFLEYPNVDPWPAQAYTHRTDIETISGDIRAWAYHGSHTNISTVSGDVTSYIKSYMASSSNATNEIHTYSQYGNFGFTILNPPEDLVREGKNPFRDTISKHEVEKAGLWLSYSSAWWGEMEGKTDCGKLKFSGNHLESVEEEEGHVVAKRGKNENSRMQAHVGNGDLRIWLGDGPGLF